MSRSTELGLLAPVHGTDGRIGVIIAVGLRVPPRRPVKMSELLIRLSSGIECRTHVVSYNADNGPSDDAPSAVEQPVVRIREGQQGLGYSGNHVESLKKEFVRRQASCARLYLEYRPRLSLR